MAKVYAFLADGSEEVELLAVVDVLIRGGQDVKLVSVTGKKDVISAHRVKIQADFDFSEVDCKDADVLFLPGGMPGTRNLGLHKGLVNALKEAHAENKRIAAICAAPSILGSLGILEGKKATCFPGFEPELKGAQYTRQGVVTDGNVTTARGLGYALDMGIELLRLLTDESHARQIKEAIQYDQIPM
ncbi:DJ-1 family glyoxalase III [Clostridium sp. Marseille-P2415]|uniref:DJ-1 family glyoxalase III n=1 Tax=Clostridium sp. Marseille-P2415 TaxID=1805471 RepID=UPI00098882D9|nr:DJ-1 family glyoxalase III [Clostridium sp. Marseille-P2415]